jgi:HK97 family phage major capsid protein
MSDMIQSLADLFGVESSNPAELRASVKTAIEAQLSGLATTFEGIADETEREALSDDYKSIKSATGAQDWEAVAATLHRWADLVKPSAVKGDAAAATRDAWDKSRKAAKPIDNGQPHVVSAQSQKLNAPNLNFGAPVPTLLDMMVDINDIRNGKPYKSFDYQTGPNGGYVTKHEVSQQILEPLRASLVLEQAGMSVIMLPDAASISIPKMTGTPEAYWGTDGPNATGVTETDAQFGMLTLNPKPLISRYKIASRMINTLFPGAQAMIQNQLVASMRLKLELAALLGTGALESGDTGASPRGLLNTTGVTSTALGSGNGADPTLLDLQKMFLRIYADNLESGDSSEAYIMHSVVAGVFQTATDLSGQPLLRPDWRDPAGKVIDGRRVLTTNQVGRNVTVGSSTDTSRIFAGQWKYLQMVLAEGIEINLFNSDYALGSVLQTGVVAHTYADFGVHYPQAFEVLTAVTANAVD